MNKKIIIISIVFIIVIFILAFNVSIISNENASVCKMINGEYTIFDGTCYDCPLGCHSPYNDFFKKVLNFFKTGKWELVPEMLGYNYL